MLFCLKHVTNPTTMYKERQILENGRKQRYTPRTVRVLLSTGQPVLERFRGTDSNDLGRNQIIQVAQQHKWISIAYQQI